MAAIAFALAVLCGVARGDDPPAEMSEILVLKNGDRVTGRSVDLSEDGLRWRMPYGREMSIPLDLIDHVEPVPPSPASPPPAEPPPAPPAEPEKKEEPKVDPAVQPAGLFVPPGSTGPLPLGTAWYEALRSTYSYSKDQAGKWVKRVETGGTWVAGNSKTSEAYIGGLFERQFDQVSHQIDWNGRDSTANGKTTQSRWQINGTSDFSKNEKSKWILFLTQRHLIDQLADLNYRASIAGGLGYRFYNEGEKRLITRIGPGITFEKYDPPIGWRETPDLFAEAEARWPVFDRTVLEYKSQFQPSLNDVGVFRMTSNYGVLVKLTQNETWAMRLGLRHDHNSKPNPGKVPDDFTTTFSLVYTKK